MLAQSDVCMWSFYFLYQYLLWDTSRVWIRIKRNKISSLWIWRNKKELVCISITICDVCSRSTVKMHAKRNQKQRVHFMSLISICLMNSFILTATHENNAYNGPYKVLNRKKRISIYNKYPVIWAWLGSCTLQNENVRHQQWMIMQEIHDYHIALTNSHIVLVISI